MKDVAFVAVVAALLVYALWMNSGMTKVMERLDFNGRLRPDLAKLSGRISAALIVTTMVVSVVVILVHEG